MKDCMLEGDFVSDNGPRHRTRAHFGLELFFTSYPLSYQVSVQHSHGQSKPGLRHSSARIKAFRLNGGSLEIEASHGARTWLRTLRKLSSVLLWLRSTSTASRALGNPPW